MLFLLFQLGKDRYALATEQVVEVLPRVNYKVIPAAPPGVAGVFNYHGAPVPLIDLSEMAMQRPARNSMSTRIILIHYRPAPEDTNIPQETHLLGLLAEEVTTILSRTPEEFEEAGVTADDAPYLGPVTTDALGIVQRIEVERLLSVAVRDALFRTQLEVS
jgi:chemotaxis-related protein WspB